jgi:hypothetical protein
MLQLFVHVNRTKRVSVETAFDNNELSKTVKNKDGIVLKTINISVAEGSGNFSVEMKSIYDGNNYLRVTAEIINDGDITTLKEALDEFERRVESLTSDELRNIKNINELKKKSGLKTIYFREPTKDENGNIVPLKDGAGDLRLRASNFREKIEPHGTMGYIGVDTTKMIEILGNVIDTLNEGIDNLNSINSMHINHSHVIGAEPITYKPTKKIKKIDKNSISEELMPFELRAKEDENAFFMNKYGATLDEILEASDKLFDLGEEAVYESNLRIPKELINKIINNDSELLDDINKANMLNEDTIRILSVYRQQDNSSSKNGGNYSVAGVKKLTKEQHDIIMSYINDENKGC